MHALIDHDFLCYARAAGAGWTAHCVDLDIAARGRTLGEAQRKLQNAIAAHVEAREADALDDDDDESKPVVWTVSHPMS